MDPTHLHSLDGQGAVQQLVQSPTSHHRHPVLAPADKGRRVAAGIAAQSGITPGGLHLVGAGVALYGGCLWGREMGGRGGGLAWLPGLPTSTYL